MILLIDNYDSFVYNLAHYLEKLGCSLQVKRNDAISVTEIKELNPSHIIISPGPCTPNEAGISLEVIEQFAAHIPILGVCLGHQAIAQAFGGRVIRAAYPYHGKASYIQHTGQNIFKNLPNPLKVGRYHSLIVEDNSLPSELIIQARTEENEIMAIRHIHYSTFGVQFHPESILTNNGFELLKNFLNE